MPGRQGGRFENSNQAEDTSRQRGAYGCQSGLKRIAEECAANGVGVKFEVLKTGFLVTFARNPAKAQEVVGKGGQKGGQKEWSDLTGRQKAILDAVAKKSTISREDLSKLLGINPSAVQKHLQRLRTLGILRRVGPDKGGHWEVVP